MHQEQSSTPLGFDHPNHPQNTRFRTPPSEPAAPQQSPQGQQQSQNQGQNGALPQQNWVDRMQIKVFGAKAAMEFYEAETQARGGKPPWQTIQIDAAFKADRGDAYRWGDKTVIQITKGELPVFIAVMLGILQSCSFKAHGPNKDKGFEIERQKKSVFFKVFEGSGNTKAVPVPFTDAIMIGHMALAQYTANYSNRISSDVVVNSLYALR